MKITSYITALAAAIWVSVFVIYPFTTYNEGTAENVRNDVLYTPYIEADKLVYRWSGDVVKSCSVSFKREIIDSADIVHQLVSTPILAKLPSEDLGAHSYEVSVDIGRSIDSGNTTYQVYEIPRCTWLQRMFPNPIPYPPVSFYISRRFDE